MLTADDYTRLPEIAPDATFAYGREKLQTGELYLPAPAESHPVIVMVHGGCWREQYGAKPLGSLCRALTESGFAVWNIDYRRNGNGGGYPQTLLDAAQGTDFVRTMAAEYHLDLSRVITMGHSAGGQLAVWLAARHRLPETSPLFTESPLTIRGVVCLAGIVDLVFAIEQEQCGDSLPMIMGGRPEQVPLHYQHASPMALLPVGVKQIHIVGENDVEIVANVRPYIAASEAAGDAVTLHIVPDAGHFEVVAPTTPAYRLVRDAALELR